MAFGDGDGGETKEQPGEAAECESAAEQNKRREAVRGRPGEYAIVPSGKGGGNGEEYEEMELCF